MRALRRGKCVLLLAALAAACAPILQCQLLEKGGVQYVVNYAPPTCKRAAAMGDDIEFHYFTRDSRGEVVDEGTRRVGRPMSMRLLDPDVFDERDMHVPMPVGARRLTPLGAMAPAIEGMCLGEKRRVWVADPTSEDDPSLAVDVELISVNAEVLTSAVELSVPSSPFAPRDPFCASCQYFVENFYIQWMLQLHRQREKAQANPNAPPSVTYDDDMEDLVQGFCAMEEVYGSDTPAWLRQGCQAIMGARKRDIVGLLLGKELNPGVVPSIRATVCRDMVQACPTDVADWAPAADAPQVPKLCGACVNVTADLRYELAIQGPKLGNKRMNLRVDAALDGACLRYAMRHGAYPNPARQACSDLVEEYLDDLVGLAESFWAGKGAWDALVVQGACVDAAGACNARDAAAALEVLGGEWSSLAASKLRGASETGAGPAAPPMGAAPRADPASSVRAPPASANGSKGGTSNESGVAPAAPRPARGLMFDARAYGDL